MTNEEILQAVRQVEGLGGMTVKRTPLGKWAYGRV
jgi:hypothetical protein